MSLALVVVVKNIKSVVEDSLLSKLNLFDWFIFFSIIALTFMAIIYGHSRRDKGQNSQDKLLDLLLMGRSLTLPMFIATLVATWYGGIFGTAKIAYESGLYNLVTQGFFWYFSYIIFALFLLDKIGKYKAITLPQLVLTMFGKKSALLAAILNIFNLVPIAYAISLGLLIQMFTSLSLNLSITLGVLFVLSYSLTGGLRAVVFSDLVQFFVMCLSVILVAIFATVSFGFGEFSTLPSSYFSLTGGYSWLQTLVWGLIALTTLVDPNFYQRAFAATSTKVAKRGILLSTVVWLIFDISLTLGAIYARIKMPEADSKTAYFIFAFDLLPHGLRGFFLAGISATILSTLDSYLFLAGTTLSFDIFGKSTLKKKGSVKGHYLGVISIGLLSILMSTIFEGNIKMVWKTLGSLSASALLVPMMMGHLFKDKFFDYQFFLSSSLGILGALVWPFWGNQDLIDPIYIGASSSLAPMIFFLLLNRKNNC
jgi:solute:Na+ symporter, SSS family